MLKTRIVTLVLGGAFIPLASASIYPTQPVQGTVWTVEQPVLVTWVDDWQYPTLDVMGPCQISLYRDTDTYLIKLASGVDPQSKSQQVTVPSDVLKNGNSQGSGSTLRFVPDTPLDIVVYSADFMINAANTTHASATSTVGGNSTSTARTSSTGPAPISSNRSSEPSTVVVPPSRPGDVGGQQQSQGSRQAKSNSAGRRIDIEKIKFRLVFVIWPVLMGITMAL
ncbi:hypothetical protein PAXINDRAFT_113943 [Paxillus involutus ATCC 200175]|nr:hypothetical protein PAXINDRAFT_113943 [Paxillus involutus ATCC 200175]